MKKLKIVHILNELKPSGAETMLTSASEIWKAKGIDLEVVSLGKNMGVYSEEFIEKGFKVRHIPSMNKFEFVKNFFKLIKKNKYDIIHVHCEGINLLIFLVAKLAGSKIIVRTVHNNFDFNGILKYRRIFTRFVARVLGVKHIFIGDSVKENEEVRLRNKGVTIYNWYDSNKYKFASLDEKIKAKNDIEIDKDTFVITSVGNCSEVKNHKLIFEALAMLDDELDIKYLHVGIEDELKIEQNICQNLNLNEKVDFLGYKKDVYKILKSSDVYIMPSRFEGFSIALLEAMAVGNIPIITDVEGLKDLKKYSNHIRYIEDFSITDLVNHILSIYNLKAEERENIGMKISNIVNENFSIEIGSNSYLNYYNFLLEKKK